MSQKISHLNDDGELLSLQEVMSKATSLLISSFDLSVCLRLFLFSLESGIPFEVLLAGFEKCAQSLQDERPPSE